MSNDLKKRFLELLERDVEFRYAVAGYLGVLEILKRLDAIEAEIKKLWEEVKALREGQEKLWQEVKELREGQNKLWENQNRLWEEVRKLWEEVKALREGQEKLWQEVKELREGQNALRADVEGLKADMSWVKSALRDLQQALGVGLEFYTARWLSQYLAARGTPCDPLVRVTLPVDGFKEVDVLCLEPLAVAEVKSSVPTAEKAEEALAQLLKAVEVAERFTGRRAELKALAVQTAPEEVARRLAERAKELGVMLVLGSES